MWNWSLDLGCTGLDFWISESKSWDFRKKIYITKTLWNLRFQWWNREINQSRVGNSIWRKSFSSSVLSISVHSINWLHLWKYGLASILRGICFREELTMGLVRFIDWGWGEGDTGYHRVRILCGQSGEYVLTFRYTVGELIFLPLGEAFIWICDKFGWLSLDDYVDCLGKMAMTHGLKITVSWWNAWCPAFEIISVIQGNRPSEAGTECLSALGSIQMSRESWRRLLGDWLDISQVQPPDKVP